MLNFKNHIDKIGIAGLILSHLCCLGVAAKISIFSALGVGFLINHAVLLPILIISLAISMLGIFTSYLKHRNVFPLALSVFSSVAILLSFFVIHIKILTYAGLFGLISASVYNHLCTRRCKSVGF